MIQRRRVRPESASPADMCIWHRRQDSWPVRRVRWVAVARRPVRGCWVHREARDSISPSTTLSRSTRIVSITISSSSSSSRQVTAAISLQQQLHPFILLYTRDCWDDNPVLILSICSYSINLCGRPECISIYNKSINVVALPANWPERRDAFLCFLDRPTLRSSKTFYFAAVLFYFFTERLRSQPFFHQKYTKGWVLGWTCNIHFDMLPISSKFYRGWSKRPKFGLDF